MSYEHWLYLRLETNNMTHHIHIWQVVSSLEHKLVPGSAFQYNTKSNTKDTNYDGDMLTLFQGHCQTKHWS